MPSHASPAANPERSDGARPTPTNQQKRRPPLRALRLLLLIAAMLVLVPSVMHPALATPVALAQRALRPAPADPTLNPPLATSTTITISPSLLPSGQAGIPYLQPLTASGGTAPYRFDVTDGALPPGLALGADGVFDGAPAAGGSFGFVVTATDARGVSAGQPYLLNILTSIALSPPELLDGKVGSAYRQVFGASGGAAPYRFAVTAGALPPGLTLGADGVLAGTPSTHGPFSFIITATDARGISGGLVYNLAIAQALAISPSLLPDGKVGTIFSQVLTASGGTAPYRFAVTDGALPSGLALSRDGLLSGAPTAQGIFNFTVTATDARGRTSSQIYNLFTMQVPLIIGPGSLGDGRVGVAYRQRLTASDGTAPYRFGVTDGALPPGLALSRDGLLSGKPTTEGFFGFTVTATDARGRTGNQFYGLSITQVSLAIGPSQIPDGKVGLVYRQRLTASGGTAPYRFAIAFGELPPGLALSRDGRLRGRPTTAGGFGVTISVTDARGHTGSASYGLVIAQALALSSPFLPSGQAGTPYLQSLTASGGTAPYRFAVTEGLLPPGMTLSPAGALSGTPTSTGFFGFAATATDARGRTGSQLYQLNIITSIALSPPELLGGRVGSAYRQAFAASGGVAPYRFAVIDGTLPPGLALGANGVLDGTPSTEGFYSFTVGATDARGISGSRFYSLFIAQALALSPPFLPQGSIENAYAVDLTVSGGTAPYSFAITIGDLPPGLTLSADGLLSGTPTAQGSFNFAITATDAHGLTGSQFYGLEIAAPLIALSPASLPDGAIGTPYQQQLSASGGTGPYVFVVPDFIPPGLVLTPAGLLHGTPIAGGSFEFAITAIDARGFAGSQSYTLSIAPISISPAALPGGVIGAAYSQQLTASGGVGPYIFLALSGTPPGLALSRDGLLSGTPTGEGFFFIDLVAIDSRGFNVRINYSLEIVAPLTIGPPALPDGAVGSAYSAGLSVTGGSFPYSFAITDGALPPGLALSDSGELGGTPTIAGVYSFTATVTDGGGRTASQQYTVAIN